MGADCEGGCPRNRLRDVRELCPSGKPVCSCPLPPSPLSLSPGSLFRLYVYASTNTVFPHFSFFLSLSLFYLVHVHRDEDSEKSDTKPPQSSAKTTQPPTGRGQGSQAAQAVQWVECMNCGKNISCNRFTGHLDKCLGSPPQKRHKSGKF